LCHVYMFMFKNFFFINNNDKGGIGSWELEIRVCGYV
jgi:hypothetical protein